MDIFIKNPNAIQLLERNQNKIDWSNLSGNQNAIHLLELNQGRIDWNIIQQNPSIFEVDYEFLKERISFYKEELIQKCFHPKRLFYYLDSYNYDIGEDEYQG